MAGLLFVYSHSSIHAAKRNAARHRAADGGQISWYNESQRRHGALEKPQEENLIKQLIADTRDKGEKVVGRGDSAVRGGGNTQSKERQARYWQTMRSNLVSSIFCYMALKNGAISLITSSWFGMAQNSIDEVVSVHSVLKGWLLPLGD